MSTLSASQFKDEINSAPAPGAPGAAPGVGKKQPPKLIRLPDGGVAPKSPKSLAETGLEQQIISDLALKLGATVPRFTTEWAAEQLKLPGSLVGTVLHELQENHYLEILGQTGPSSYRYAITQLGRDTVKRLVEISGYVGPAPVSLDSYTALLKWQVARMPEITFDRIKRVVAPLVLPDEAVEVSALAATSGRSLFLFGPPGNGKTSMARLLHEALEGELWIPYCINIESHIIRIFDDQCHDLIDPTPGGGGRDSSTEIDQRWIRIKRPLLVAGGEMTIAELDLAYSPSLRFYEAPPHVKANGGTFVIDDFGRQHVDPRDLLNRWIIPLESQIDHFTLNTGQKIQLPFKLMLVVATNLNVSEVADPAFLRRMGYRLFLDKPGPQAYRNIFERYAATENVQIPEGMIERLLARYQMEGRELRAAEPRDLIERARDICRLRKHDFTLSDEVMDLAWTGYFGRAGASGHKAS